MSAKSERVSLNDLAGALGISPSVARALGKNALLNQLAEQYGHPTTRCEDCRTAGQYTGDLEGDFEGILRRRLKRNDC